ncbi:MAG: ADP-ribosylglycohydrolase family protein, partial [Anaerolineae bacterium]
RVAPVGLYFYDAPDLYEMAQLSARVTHAHPVGIDGAAVQARAVAEAVALDPDEPFLTDGFLHVLLSSAQTPALEQQLERVWEFIHNDAPPQEAVRELGQGVSVYWSLPFAIYSFVRHPDSFEDCLFCATLNGGDRDTLGAMACAVSGARLGIEAIPPPWRERLENREYITDLALRLAGTR